MEKTTAHTRGASGEGRTPHPRRLRTRPDDAHMVEQNYPDFFTALRKVQPDLAEKERLSDLRDWVYQLAKAAQDPNWPSEENPADREMIVSWLHKHKPSADMYPSEWIRDRRRANTPAPWEQREKAEAEEVDPETLTGMDCVRHDPITYADSCLLYGMDGGWLRSWEDYKSDMLGQPPAPEKFCSAIRFCLDHRDLPVSELPQPPTVEASA